MMMKKLNNSNVAKLIFALVLSQTNVLMAAENNTGNDLNSQLPINADVNNANATQTDATQMQSEDKNSTGDSNAISVDNAMSKDDATANSSANSAASDNAQMGRNTEGEMDTSKFTYKENTWQTPVAAEFSKLDVTGNGLLKPNEASKGKAFNKKSFAKADTDHDGTIDLNEYTFFKTGANPADSSMNTSQTKEPGDMGSTDATSQQNQQQQNPPQ